MQPLQDLIGGKGRLKSYSIIPFGELFQMLEVAALGIPLHDPVQVYPHGDVGNRAQSPDQKVRPLSRVEAAQEGHPQGARRPRTLGAIAWGEPILLRQPLARKDDLR